MRGYCRTSAHWKYWRLCSPERNTKCPSSNAPVSRKTLKNFGVGHVLTTHLALGLPACSTSRAFGLESFAAHQAVGEILAQFDAGLVEGVDVVQLARVGRLHFEQIQQRADGLLIHAREANGAVRFAVLGQRQFGRPLLGVDQFVERVPAEILHGVEIGKRGRNRHGRAEFVHGQERDDLVERSFDVKLHDRMLVGHAQRFLGRLARVHPFARAIDAFAEALGPELTEPIRHVAQRVRVRHHHLDVLALRLVHQIMQRRARERRVFPELLRFLAERVHLRRAAQQLVNVDARDRRAEQADGAEHGETPAHVGRNRQRRVAEMFHDLAQFALLRVGGDDDVFDVPFGAELLDQRLAEDEELAHRLGGAARLGDHVEHGVVEIDGVEQRGDAVGVDVVGHEQSRAAPRRAIEMIVLGMIERAVERDVAEGRPADADDDEIVAPLLDFAGENGDLVGELRVVGQLAEPERGFLDRVRGGSELRPERLEFGVGDTVLADTLGHQIIEIVA